MKQWISDEFVPQGEPFVVRVQFILNPDPQNPKPQLLSGHWRHVGEFVRYEHVCPGDGCAIARWIREHTR